MMPDCHWWHFASISNSAGLGMGTVVNIGGWGRGWKDMRGWGGLGN